MWRCEGIGGGGAGGLGAGGGGGDSGLSETQSFCLLSGGKMSV